MTNYVVVNGKTYWACPECGSISGCTFGHCLNRVEKLTMDERLHPPVFESTCLECLLGICKKYGTSHT